MPFAIVTALAQVLVRQVPLAPVRAFPGRPGGRPCCILSRDLPPAAATNIVSPAALGVHRAGSELGSHTRCPQPVRSSELAWRRG